MENKLSIHDKAIRLIEGGIVEVDGHSVRVIKIPDGFEPCANCKMDCLCHVGSEMCSVCIECCEISKRSCIIEFARTSKNRP